MQKWIETNGSSPTVNSSFQFSAGNKEHTSQIQKIKLYMQNDAILYFLTF